MALAVADGGTVHSVECGPVDLPRDNPCVYQQPSVDFEPLNGGFTGTSPSCHTCKELLLLDIVCMSIIIILGPLLVILLLY